MSFLNSTQRSPLWEVEINLAPNLQRNLTQHSDKIIYEIAKETLIQSKKTIPMRTGNMRRSSINAGVKGSNRDYYIGSYTGYAKYVWNFPDSTNWTTPGTNNKWYYRIWKAREEHITKNIVGRNKL